MRLKAPEADMSSCSVQQQEFKIIGGVVEVPDSLAPHLVAVGFRQIGTSAAASSEAVAPVTPAEPAPKIHDPSETKAPEAHDAADAANKKAAELAVVDAFTVEEMAADEMKLARFAAAMRLYESERADLIVKNVTAAIMKFKDAQKPATAPA